MVAVVIKHLETNIINLMVDDMLITRGSALPRTLRRCTTSIIGLLFTVLFLVVPRHSFLFRPKMACVCSGLPPHCASWSRSSCA